MEVGGKKDAVGTYWLQILPGRMVVSEVETVLLGTIEGKEIIVTVSLKGVNTSIPAKQREHLPGFAPSGGVKSQMRVDCPDYEQGLIDAQQRVEEAQKAAQGPSKAVLEKQAADRRAQRKMQAAEKKAMRATLPRSNGSVSPQFNGSVSPVKETTSKRGHGRGSRFSGNEGADASASG